MYLNRLRECAVSGAAAWGGNDGELGRWEPLTTLLRAAWPSAPLLRQKISAIWRMRSRPPTRPGGPPWDQPQARRREEHWEDPLLWVLVMH
jgi:hypothetical protein